MYTINFITGFPFTHDIPEKMQSDYKLIEEAFSNHVGTNKILGGTISSTATTTTVIDLIFSYNGKLYKIPGSHTFNTTNLDDININFETNALTELDCENNPFVKYEEEVAELTASGCACPSLGDLQDCRDTCNNANNDFIEDYDPEWVTIPFGGVPSGDLFASGEPVPAINSNIDPSIFQPTDYVQIKKNFDNTVSIRGSFIVKNSVLISLLTSNLPTSYRPIQNYSQLFAGGTSFLFGRFFVQAGGGVGIIFQAAPSALGEEVQINLTYSLT